MNLKPVTLFDLKPINPEEYKQSFRGQPTMTVMKGRVNISRCLFDKLLQPESVEIVTDTEKNIIGIKAAEKGSKYALPIYTRHSSFSVNGSFLSSVLNLRKINLNSRYLVLTDPWYEGGYFLFDADKGFVQKKRTIKR